ncbi:SPFH domain-containing protein [Sphingobacterium sp. T2]|uniref:SPFH domain-containing protein n=1 Tax=Sphingobacterium sp. T2 TaxID=1590596 RepID=UPI000B280184|nr:SPFH domain-containing protein [Sphingobacterium sp. T2]
MERIVKPTSGILALLVAIVFLGLSVYSVVLAIGSDNPFMVLVAILFFLVSFFIFKGVLIVQPNHSRVLNFFGKYVGTIKDNGLFFVNPLYSATKMSLRSENLQGQTLKVNDKMGNPIEIAAVIVWKIGDTYKAAYEVERVYDYVRAQSEAAVRHLAVSFAYDDLEDDSGEDYFT